MFRVLYLYILIFCFSAVQGKALALPVCERTEQIKLFIEAYLGKNCAQISIQELSSISGKMDLSEQGLSTLKVGDFSGLSSVKELSLHKNQLGLNEPLPAGVFTGLTELRVLSITENQLKELAVNLFAGLNKLEKLYLSRNFLQILQVGVFVGLPNLKVLLVSDNELNHLEMGAFEGLHNLEVLFIMLNHLKSLQAGLFEPLSNLKDFALNSNQLNHLELGVFRGLSRLEELNLAKNNLSDLPEGIFTDLNPHTLTDLGLTSNPLPKREKAQIAKELFEIVGFEYAQLNLIWESYDY